MEVSKEVPAVGYGSARVRHSGDDVTVVAWGNCIEFALEAASELVNEASVDVIDLRSIVPWDRGTVIASLEKTGRLVVVQEDSVSGSVGQMIVSEMVWRSGYLDTILQCSAIGRETRCAHRF